MDQLYYKLKKALSGINLQQLMGFILLIGLIALNTVFAFTCTKNNSCAMLDTFSWGFINALVMILGLTSLGGK